MTQDDQIIQNTVLERSRNQILGASLAALAARLQQIPSPDLPFSMGMWVYSKEEILAAVRAIGGKWKKEGWTAEGDNYSVRLESVDFPPLQIYCPRDKVCRKTVTWECEPLFSKAEEAEVDAALAEEAPLELAGSNPAPVEAQGDAAGSGTEGLTVPQPQVQAAVEGGENA